MTQDWAEETAALVTAFFIHIVRSGLIPLQRPQIAARNSQGDRDREIGAHCAPLATLMALAGILPGVLPAFASRPSDHRDSPVGSGLPSTVP